MLDQKKLGFTINEFRDEMNNHLHSDDYELVELLFLPVDNKNLINLLLKTGESFDESGILSQEELEEIIKEPSTGPLYMQKLIIAFKSETPVFDGLSWEDQLTWLYYDYAGNCSNKFLREWLEFDLDVKNIVAGFNVRKHKLKGEMVYIGDNYVVQAVRKSTLKDFGLSNDFEYMEKLISVHENENLLEREKAMDMMRWDFLDDRNTLNFFSVEVLLAYVIKLQMVQRWLELDYETGKEMFRKLLDQLEQSYEFPEEFKITQSRAQKER